MSFYVSAVIKCKKGRALELKAYLLILVNDTRNEKACLQFDLFQSLNNENVFIINGQWLERSWFNIYSKQEYVNKFREMTAPLLLPNGVDVIYAERIA